MKDNYPQKPIISGIVAMSRKNNTIGSSNGKIPWHIKEDFAYFKEKTYGHPIIMGRKTFETFKNPLPGRIHIVVSRTQTKNINPNIIWVTNIEDAILRAKEIDSEEIFVIGGGQIYELALNYIKRLYITYIDGNFEGDVFFPNFEEKNFRKIFSKFSNEKNYSYEFTIFEK